MKKVILALVLMLMCSPAVAVDYTKITGAKATYLMNVDENPITDSTGTNTGALLSADNPNFTTSGKFGGGYSFDGSDKITVTDSADFDVGGSISMTAWVYVTSSGTYKYIISKTVSGQENKAFLLSNENPPKMWAFLYPWTGLAFAKSTRTVSLNAWHHLAYTFENNSLIFYLDGEEETAIARTLSNASDSTGDVLIGDSGNNEFFYGTMDDVGWFNIALTKTQINDIMDNGLSPTAITAQGSIFRDSIFRDAVFK